MLTVPNKSSQPTGSGACGESVTFGVLIVLFLPAAGLIVRPLSGVLVLAMMPPRAEQQPLSCFHGALDGVEICRIGLGSMARRQASSSLLPLGGVVQMFRVVLLVPYSLLVVVYS